MGGYTIMKLHCTDKLYKHTRTYIRIYCTIQVQHWTSSHLCNYWQQSKLLKSRYDIYFNRKSSSPNWRHEDSRLKWMPRPLLKWNFVLCIIMSANKCDVVLGLHCIYVHMFAYTYYIKFKVAFIKSNHISIPIY